MYIIEHTMKIITTKLGVAAYYTVLPAFAAYGLMSRHPRTRAVVLSGDSVYLVKNWLSPQQWTMPGGGVERGETELMALRRELNEEINFDIYEDKFTHIGTFRYTNLFATYRYSAYVATVDKNTLDEMEKPFGEVIPGRWFRCDDLPHDVSDEFINAYRRYIDAT